MFTSFTHCFYQSLPFFSFPLDWEWIPLILTFVETKRKRESIAFLARVNPYVNKWTKINDDTNKDTSSHRVRRRKKRKTLLSALSSVKEREMSLSLVFAFDRKEVEENERRKWFTCERIFTRRTDSKASFRTTLATIDVERKREKKRDLTIHCPRKYKKHFVWLRGAFVPTARSLYCTRGWSSPSNLRRKPSTAEGTYPNRVLDGLC